MDTPKHIPPLAYGVNDGAAQIGVTRSKLYDLAARGEIQLKKIDGRTIVEHAELVRYLAAIPAAPIGLTTEVTSSTEAARWTVRRGARP